MKLILTFLPFALLLALLYVIVLWLEARKKARVAQRPLPFSEVDEPLAEESGRYPYVRREPFLSNAERQFLPALDAAVKQISEGKGRVYVQVQLSRLICVETGAHEWQRWHNRIDRKSVDFVVTDSRLVPRIAVELDDRSHERADRRERDGFVERALKDAGVQLVRVKVRREYDVGELVGLLAERP